MLQCQSPKCDPRLLNPIFRDLAHYIGCFLGKHKEENVGAWILETAGLMVRPQLQYRQAPSDLSNIKNSVYIHSMRTGTVHAC